MTCAPLLLGGLTWRPLASGCHPRQIQPYTRTLKGVWRKDAAAYKASCTGVLLDVRQALRGVALPLEVPFRVGLLVEMPPGTSTRRLPLASGDWDNLLKGWLDALQPSVLPGDGPHWFRGPAPVEMPGQGLEWPGVVVADAWCVRWTIWTEAER